MTNISSNALSRKLRRVGAAMRNAPLILCCVGASLSLEAFAAFGIVSQGDGVTRFFEAALCLFCGLTALVVSGAATEMKRDPRDGVRRSAGAARLVSFLLLIPSSFYVGQSFAFEDQRIKASEFRASDAYTAAQQALATAETTREKLEAAAELERGTIPRRAEFAPLCMLWAAFFLTANSLAIGVGRRPKAETEAEAKRRVLQERVAKAQATRKRNAKKPAPEPVGSNIEQFRKRMSA